ncbi:hypothetical protein GCM10009841_14860 [Microlunatus panaciterrae]|uniref:Uncharacterized protein n=1 Tax=Microlunatus panaciterrae TaxID=400768 RepID=A0ABS2RM18_9ACTN|nr:hypothetical protein [Microlunatus panaciterrae]
MTSRLVTILGFVLGGLALLVLEVWARRTDRSQSLAGILDRVMERRVSRLTILLFWWWLGWHFLLVPAA